MATNTGTDRYCAGCVTSAGYAGDCVQCGWNDLSHPEGHTHLPRHYLLMKRYYIGRVLGQGGFGVTYLARDLRLSRPVAIKEFFPSDQCARLTDRITIRSHGGDKAEQYAFGLERFLEEGRMLGQFESHPCIVPIVDVAEDNGTAYLVMSYQDGIDLKQHLINRGGRIPYAQAIALMMPVMDALREVHRHGILHRDISPDNIFLTRTGQVKLLDFGAARHAIGEQSQSLSVILKQGYAPEEQYRTKGKQGAWTDVYAAAATLYRCITGAAPPTAPDRMAEDELIPPTSFCSDLPAIQEAVILRALAVRAKDRLQTMEEFQQELLRTATPPPPISSSTKVPQQSPAQLSQIETVSAIGANLTKKYLGRISRKKLFFLQSTFVASGSMALVFFIGVVNSSSSFAWLGLLFAAPIFLWCLLWSIGQKPYSDLKIIFDTWHTSTQVSRLFKAIRKAGYGTKRSDIFLTRHENIAVLSFVVGEGIWDKAEMVEQFKTIVRKAAPAIGGLPVRLQWLNVHSVAQRAVVVTDVSSTDR